MKAQQTACQGPNLKSYNTSDVHRPGYQEAIPHQRGVLHLASAKLGRGGYLTVRQTRRLLGLGANRCFNEASTTALFHGFTRQAGLLDLSIA